MNRGYIYNVTCVVQIKEKNDQIQVSVQARDVLEAVRMAEKSFEDMYNNDLKEFEVRECVIVR